MPYTPEQLDDAAKGYAKGDDRSWWPECPETFRDTWRMTADMLQQAARDARLRQGVEKLRDAANEKTQTLVAADQFTEAHYHAYYVSRLRALLAETETP